MKEEWRVIVDFPDYMISNLGRVKRIKSGLILKPYRNKDGYSRVDLYKNKEPEHKYIHHLVFENFNNCIILKNECVHHKDENIENNNFNNLIKMDKFDHNSIHHKGKNHPLYGKSRSTEIRDKIRRSHINKYDDEKINQIIEIKILLRDGKLSQRKIGEKFGVSKSIISLIKNEKRWSHIKLE